MDYKIGFIFSEFHFVLKLLNLFVKILASENICAWDGHFYALKAIQDLDLEKIGGVTRLGVSLYNTEEEMDRTIEIISKI